MVRICNSMKGQKKRQYLYKNMPKSEVLLWTKLKKRKTNIDGACQAIFHKIEEIKNVRKNIVGI